MKQYTVDAFSDRVFSGNQAAVCIVDEWPEDAFMADLALENNYSETAFLLPRGKGYLLRWFTPGGEIDLCGHATLGAAYVACEILEPGRTQVDFGTKSGTLSVSQQNGFYEIDFPAFELERIDVSHAMEEALGARPVEAYLGRDLLCVMESGDMVRNLEPDLAKVRELEGLLCHATARGAAPYDCVSRSFAPKMGVEEDPVCGSGHCHILPYWSKQLGKDELLAHQASRRGGTIAGRVRGNRVTLGGKAVLFCTSELAVDPHAAK